MIELLPLLHIQFQTKTKNQIQTQPNQPTHSIGYCTNVHPGRNLRELRQSLLCEAAEVSRLVGGTSLPLGVWLSAETARQLHEQPDEAKRLRDDVMQHGMYFAAVNAFPYSNFGAARVKTLVYEPNWCNAGRALYTMAVAELLPLLLPVGATHASISTLPLGWRPKFSAEGCGASVGIAAAQLEQTARGLARIEARTGLRITLDIEPEPGCAIQTSQELVDFITHCLRPSVGDQTLRRHLGACVDICHGAVMGEAPERVFDLCNAAGIEVHRVHLSSALMGDTREQHLRALQRFDEPRYLHQVVTGCPHEPRVWEDIPNFLDWAKSQAAQLHQPSPASRTEWRCHFHLPIFLRQVENFSTTTDAIEPSLRRAATLTNAFIEVETYAWAQLPTPAAANLPEGIAREILHARALLAKVAHSVEAST